MGVSVRPDTIPGLLEAGNIDLLHRPRVRNPNGTISTVRSMSFEENGKEILVPTVSDDGRILSDDQAIALYHKTGRHLGIFRDATAATAYAKALHEAQARLIQQAPLDSSPPPTGLLAPPAIPPLRGLLYLPQQ